MELRLRSIEVLEESDWTPFVVLLESGIFMIEAQGRCDHELRPIAALPRTHRSLKNSLSDRVSFPPS